MHSLRCATGLVVAALSLAGTAHAQVVESFENGFGAWEVDSHINPIPPEPPPEFIYTVTRSQAQASDGSWSLDFTIDGTNDDGTVWIVRSFDVPAGEYNVEVSFDFWDSVNSDINNWPVVGYIGSIRPEVESDFAILGETGVMGWTPYTHSLAVSHPGGPLWVAAGCSVIWESWRTHFIDRVAVSGLPVVDPPVPAMSSIGLVVLGATVLSAGAVLVRRCR